MLHPFTHLIACCYVLLVGVAQSETGQTFSYVQTDATTPEFVRAIISPILKIYGKLINVRYISHQWPFKVLEHSKCLPLKMKHDVNQFINKLCMQKHKYLTGAF